MLKIFAAVVCLGHVVGIILASEAIREAKVSTPSLKVDSPPKKCKIKCGVISQRRGDVDLLYVVKETWRELKVTRGLGALDMFFEEKQPMHDLGMDSMIQAYIHIGNNNVQAVIGPFVSTMLAATLKFGLPYFLTEGHAAGSRSRSNYAYEHLVERPYNLLSTRPRLADLSELALDFAGFFNWTSVAVLYVGKSGTKVVERLIRTPKLHVTSWIVPRRKSSNNNNYNYNDLPDPPTTTGVNGDETSKDGGEEGDDDDGDAAAISIKRILLEMRGASFTSVLLVDPGRDLDLEVIFNEALKLSMFTSQYDWIYLSLERPFFDHTMYQFSGVNLVTAHVTLGGSRGSGETANQFGTFSSKHYSSLEVLQIVDSLLTIYSLLTWNFRESGNCTLSGEERLNEGLAKVSLETFTGRLMFRKDGSRTGYLMDIHALGSTGLKQIGTWNSTIPPDKKGRLQLDRSLLHVSRSDGLSDTSDTSGTGGGEAGAGHGADGMQAGGKGGDRLEKTKRHFTVVVPEEFPFAMLRPDHANRTESDRYHGYCLDVIKELSRDLSFNYDVIVVSDDVVNYCCGADGVGGGGKGGGGGNLLAMIQNGTASFGLPFPLTSASNKHLDLTTPLTSTQWSVLMIHDGWPDRDAHRHPGSRLRLWLFVFTEPFPPEVWLLLVGAVIVAACCLYSLENLDLLRPAEERLTRGGGGGGGGENWRGNCIGCRCGAEENDEVQGHLEASDFCKGHGFVSDSDLTERPPSIDYSFDEGRSGRFALLPCCCSCCGCDCRKSTPASFPDASSAGRRYLSLSFVQCLWIVITMMTLRDLNSPIRLLHRTTVGRVFSLLLRSFSLIVIVVYAASFTTLVSKLEATEAGLRIGEPFQRLAVRILARDGDNDSGTSRVYLPSREVESHLFDPYDAYDDDTADEAGSGSDPFRYDPTQREGAKAYAWKKLLTSDRLSYLSEMSASGGGAGFNSSRRSSILESLFVAPTRALQTDRSTVVLWHMAGANHISSKICLSSDDAVGSSRAVVEPVSGIKSHKRKLHLAIALPQGTSLRAELSAGILRLREQGTLDKLERRWGLRPLTRCPTEAPDGRSQRLISNANVKMFAGLSAVFSCLWIANVFWAIIKGGRNRCPARGHQRGDERGLRLSKNENHHHLQAHHASLRLSSHEGQIQQQQQQQQQQLQQQAQHIQQQQQSDVSTSSPQTFDQSMAYNVASETGGLPAPGPSSDMPLASASTMPDLHEGSSAQGFHHRDVHGAQRYHHHHHHQQQSTHHHQQPQQHHHHHHHRHRHHNRRRDRSAGAVGGLQKSKGDVYPTWRRQTNIF